MPCTIHSAAETPSIHLSILLSFFCFAFALALYLTYLPSRRLLLCACLLKCQPTADPIINHSRSYKDGCKGSQRLLWPNYYGRANKPSTHTTTHTHTGRRSFRCSDGVTRKEKNPCPPRMEPTTMHKYSVALAEDRSKWKHRIFAREREFEIFRDNR
jgi:hypothetical protein